MAADELRSFLVNLATDPARLGEFIRDPDAAMSDTDLDTQDQAALKSGNPAAIYARITGQEVTAPSQPVTVLVVDLVRASGEDAEDTPVIRGLPTFPQQIFPQVFPQVTPLQIAPQQIFPQVTPLQIAPQQVFPQITPLQIAPQQVFPQVFPQVTPLQVAPQQVFPQITPLQIAPQQVFPQVAPQVIWPFGTR